MAEHWIRTAHVPALAITNDGADGKEGAMPQTPTGAARTSGKLRSSPNTAAVHRVTYPHEYVYTPEGEPSEYESMSSMTFVTGFMTIMDLQSDPIRNHMWADLWDLMHDGERFG